MSYPAKRPFANPNLSTHYALVLEAEVCAEQVLPLFERAHPDDVRPRQALDTLREWVQGEASMIMCRRAAFAAHAAGQAAAVAHMYTHAPHAATYAAKATALATLISPAPR